jgi:hypothetical protein
MNIYWTDDNFDHSSTTLNGLSRNNSWIAQISEPYIVLDHVSTSWAVQFYFPNIGLNYMVNMFGLIALKWITP